MKRITPSVPAIPPAQFRHEYKYQITQQQLSILKEQLPDLLQPDPHVGQKGYYQIRSLYFDDFRNTYFYENENGTEPREKFRIRIYNGSSERIRLELKRKEQGMVHKRSCPISKEITDRLIRGETLPWQEDMDPLLRKFCILQETKLLAPKVIVEYDRFPYIYPDGNVRITLDLNIGTSTRFDDFFANDISTRPIMPVGSHLLEAKFDQLLPDFIYNTLQKQHLKRVTYSKYYLCRKFGAFL